MSNLQDDNGKIFLVGAGPGDPGLLTLRGKACLESADVILYDYLANPDLLNAARPSAERIYVGRRGRGGYQDQGEINRVMIERARAGRTVVRLKGGDPFMFGRGGEEAEAIAAAGLSFEIIPGVTSAVAVPAYAGIPVTHRTLASTVAFVTGHEDLAKGESSLEWPKLATAEGTLVFLMGMKTLPAIVEKLTNEGKAPTTPVAVIQWGTRPAQRTVVGTLADIAVKIQDRQMGPPAVVVVGEVVRLRERLNWFETRPLFGKRILITRPREQAPELSNLLAAYGAEPLEMPTIAIVPPEDWREMDQAVAELCRFQWLVFTSVNGIGPFMARLRAAGHDTRSLSGMKICCIGPRTAGELAKFGLHADLVPDEYQAEGLIEAMAQAGVAGSRVLISRAAVAREILPEELRRLGCDVNVVTAYRTVLPEVDRRALHDRLRDASVDVVTFTSSSTVQNFEKLFESRKQLCEMTAKTVVACIGPITARTAADAGLTVHILAAQNTVPSLAEAVLDYFQGRSGGPVQA